jgi:hypothetical protein
MNLKPCIALVLAGFGVLVFAQPPAPTADDSAGKRAGLRFEKYDADGDGKLTALEISRNAGIQRKFTNLDRNHDDVLSPAEFAMMEAQIERAPTETR